MSIGKNDENRLPTSANNNGNFNFRFRGHMNNSGDTFNLDDVSLTAMPIPSATNSTVTTSGNLVPTQGGIATITVTVKDQSNNPIEGIAPGDVVISATGANNDIVQPAVPTNTSGQVSGSIQSITAGDKIITVVVNGIVEVLNGNILVVVVKGQS
jgi:hypothetical protein